MLVDIIEKLAVRSSTLQMKPSRNVKSEFNPSRAVIPNSIQVRSGTNLQNPFCGVLMQTRRNCCNHDQQLTENWPGAARKSSHGQENREIPHKKEGPYSSKTSSGQCGPRLLSAQEAQHYFYITHTIAKSESKLNTCSNLMSTLICIHIRSKN